MSAPRIHTLKIWPPFLELIAAGKKRFELRRNDRDYREGDVLDLVEFDPKIGGYTGRRLRVQVTYILRIRDMDTGLKTALGLNPALAPVNDLAVLSICPLGDDSPTDMEETNGQTA